MRYQNVARPGWSWLAFSVLLITSSATILAWFFVRAQESSHVRSVTRLMTSTAHADLAVDVQNWVGDQISLAKLWEFDDPSREEWALFAKLFIQEHRGCRAIAWLDANNEKRWVMSFDGQSFADIPLAKDGAAKPMLDKALRSRQVAFSNLLLTKGGETVHLSAAPIFQRNKFHGFVIAWINVRSSLDEMTADIKGLPMSLEVDEGGQQIYFMPGSNKENVEWAQSSELVLPGPVWQLRVWPTRMGMRTIRSKLPSLTLLFGALFSFLLTWLAYAHTRLKQEILERGRAEEAVKLSEARFSGILEISPAGVISTNESQRITLFNQSAEKIFGYRADEVLGQPLDMLIPEHFRAIHKHHFASFAQSPERSMLLSAHRLVFGRRKDGSEFPMAAALSKLDLGRERIFTALCSDMTREVRAEEELLRTHDELESRVLARTAALQKAYNSLESEIMERKAVEDEVLHLSGKIMRLQDEERRHLARELHDGTAQNLVALTLNLHRLREVVCHNEAEITQLEECVRMVEQCSNELRSIAYLLHPPMLEELGLSRALRGYVEGFEKRSRIAVTLACPEDFGTLDFEIQLTIFRIVQEALSNVLKHSQSATASIALSCEAGNLCLEISDQGHGIPEGREQSGVGLAGMRERVRLLHGQLTLRSSAKGTVMRVTLPLTVSVAAMAAGAGSTVLPTGRPRSARTRATDL
jgi:PAS domain S-box-containing protein